MIATIGPKTPYGRAEFGFCPVFKEGRLVELWIVVKYKRLDRHHVIIPKSLRLINYYIDAHSVEAHNWTNYWCKEHNTVCNVWYVVGTPARVKVRAASADTLHIGFWPK